MFQRTIHQKLLNQLKNNKKFIQVLIGPRQVGKTAMAKQLTMDWKGPVKTIVVYFVFLLLAQKKLF